MNLPAELEEKVKELEAELEEMRIHCDAKDDHCVELEQLVTRYRLTSEVYLGERDQALAQCEKLVEALIAINDWDGKGGENIEKALAEYAKFKGGE